MNENQDLYASLKLLIEQNQRYANNFIENYISMYRAEKKEKESLQEELASLRRQQ